MKKDRCSSVKANEINTHTNTKRRRKERHKKRKRNG
jgi:hypothetical protein